MRISDWSSDVFSSDLEFNAAARVADYSTSGTVVTWKFGANYMPISGLRFRATRSRDIRGPNVAELFTGGSQGIGTARHPITGETVDVVTLTRGNPNQIGRAHV